MSLGGDIGAMSKKETEEAQKTWIEQKADRELLEEGFTTKKVEEEAR